MIYEPAEDSLLLQKHVKKYAKGKVLDLGSGSGIQALTALKKTKDVLAVDINPKAVDTLREKGLKAEVSDLFSNVKEKFDLIIFNPPYLPRDDEEPEDSAVITTGGKEGYEVIERFLQHAKKFLTSEGRILLVCSSLTGDVEKLFKKYSYRFKKLEEEKIFFERLFVYYLQS
ncbi:methyltransferase [Candidatus Woesearchaeota archaeon]|nr:methyltransferase [Candidatus Woesearchaeota archaeon]